ncbi:hypothetical protein [Pyrodictium abyssi]|uniref:Uncharacterized protein n=1 Tax=Pyrodictium abyssi TaxID=54256 RepID=A0ABN6ZS30_9CREN|nr:hypothetical protein PABY_08300 [Pyrodictium abyssi]
MVVVYRCRECGYVLYVHWRMGQSSYGLPTPSEIASWFGGLCPRCGHRLGRPQLDDVDTVADRELVAARIELLKRELEAQRPILLSRPRPEVAVHG